jgi:peptidoglycan lytic transglycosylase
MPRAMWMAAGLALACSVAGGDASAQGTQRLSGVASYYSKDYTGAVASGPRYDPKKFTAAHRTLPFGTRLRVTDNKTHRSVTVTVNDRGPFVPGRILDLSLAAATQMHMVGRGLISVTASVQPTSASDPDF